MPYPVPPPTPPAIINVLPPEDASQSGLASIATVDQTATTPAPSATPSPTPSPICAPERFSAGCRVYSATIPPEPDAADLGTPVEADISTDFNGRSPEGFGLTNLGSDLGARSQSVSPAPLPVSVPTPTGTSERVVPSRSIPTPSRSSDSARPTAVVADVRSATAPPGRQMSLMGLPVIPQERDTQSGVAQSPAVPDVPTLEPASPQLPDTPNSSPAPVAPSTPSSPAVPPASPELGVPAPTDEGEVLTIPEQPAPEPPAASQPDSQPDQSLPDLTPDFPAEAGTSPGVGTDPAQPADPGQVVPIDPSGTGGVIELTADRQEYDSIRQVFVAEGNVEMRFQGAVLNSEFLRVNLPNRVAVAEGEAILVRGEQVLQGDRFEYNFVRGEGTVFNASGEAFVPTAGSDFSPTLPTDVTAGSRTEQILAERIAAEQPSVQPFPTGSGISATIGAGEDAESGIEGQVNRIRFEAERIDFYPEGWRASNVRLTNDPFSPPELELRSPQVTYTRQSETRSEIRARNPRIVFDQGFSLPLLRDRVVIDRRERDPGLVQFGFDNEDRGGLFVERTFDVVTTPAASFSVTPQIYLQRALTDNGGNFFEPSNFGLSAEFDARLDSQTTIEGSAVVTTFDPEEFSDELRASVRARRRLGDHRLALEYSYRDRLFNGSLGYQDVESSLGLVLTSPSIPIGNTGIDFSYQVGAQYVTANTDREDLLPPPPRDGDENEASLGRFQATAALSRGFLLWQGAPLPATPEEGLRYSPYPLVPYLSAYVGLRGVYNAYTNGENQTTLTGTVGLQGQLGRFSDNFLDYTAFNLALSQTAKAGDSPFFFDRVEDRQVLSLGLVQQIYGPIRFGFQTSINLDRDEEIDTDYTLEYRRRTYSVVLRFNPVREVGSLRLQINDFNWTGVPDRFSGQGATSTGGVQRLD
jgi:hypothetical protein